MAPTRATPATGAALPRTAATSQTPLVRRDSRLRALAGSLFCVWAFAGCPQGASAPQAPRYSVRMLAVGDDPKGVIAAVASGTGFDVRIARGLVERAPMPIRSGISDAEAQALAAALREAGAEVAVVEIPQ